MRLIRLASSNETQADITNNFRESIKFSPKTKVALQSLSLSYPSIFAQPKNGDDLEFSVQYTTTGTTVNLSGDYRDYPDSHSLVLELMRLFNSSVSFLTYGVNSSRRTEWYVYQDDKTSKLNIKYYATTDENQITQYTVTSGITVAGSDISKQGTSGNPPDIDFLISKKQICRGIGLFESVIESDTITPPNGLVIGLSRQQGTVFDLNLLYIGVKISGGNYIGLDGTPLNQAYNKDDLVRIRINSGVITLFVVRGTTTLFSINEDMIYDEYLYGCYASADAFIIKSAKYTPSPYIGTTIDSLIDLSEVDYEDNTLYKDGAQLGIPPSGQPPRLTLTLRKDTARFLGFQYASLVKASNTVQFTGGNPFLPQVVVFPEALAIEFVNLNCLSYDYINKGRRNIIHYSSNPKPNIDSHLYVYNANQLIFIDCNFIEETPINHFQFRILDKTNTPILINECYITVVLED